MLPCEKERLVQQVDEVEDYIVICHTVKLRARKLTIDENNLQIKI